jgi:hypothetical protein
MLLEKLIRIICKKKCAVYIYSTQEDMSLRAMIDISTLAIIYFLRQLDTKIIQIQRINGVQTPIDTCPVLSLPCFPPIVAQANE